MTASRCVIVVTALALLGVVVRAQKPTFKSSTALIEVDAVVLDHHGEFFRGLRPDDVTLLENGKPQKIQQFFLVTHDPALPETGGAVESGPTQYDAHRISSSSSTKADSKPSRCSG